MKKRHDQKARQDETITAKRSEEKFQLSFVDAVVRLDQEWTAALSICAHEESSAAWLRPLMKAVEISLHGVLWLLGTVLAFIMTHRVNDIELLVNLFFLLILDLIVVGTTKLLFRRARPSNNRMDMFATVSVDKFSFPSGHTTRAAMVTFFLVHKVLKKRFAPLVIAFCVFVGLSRVLLGRHHVLDVFAGFVIGTVQYWCYLPFWVPFHVIEEWLDDLLSHLHL